MTSEIRVLPVGMVIPEDEANPQHVRRMISVADQLADGRRGGGPKCPWPDCGARALKPMPQDDRYQCDKCLRGATARVTVDGFTVATICLSAPRPSSRQVDPPALSLAVR